MKKLWQWLWTGTWPWPKQEDAKPDADKILTCDLCADPDIQVGCHTHRLILCGHCTTFHNDHSQRCVLYLLDVPTNAQRRAYAQRFDAI